MFDEFDSQDLQRAVATMKDHKAAGLNLCTEQLRYSNQMLINGQEIYLTIEIKHKQIQR